jgi:hypothetical protein
VFPKVTLRPSGDRVIENGLLANAFEGFSVGNLNFGTGPVDDWAWPDATDRPFLYARDTAVPWQGTNGWQPNNTVTLDAGDPAKITDTQSGALIPNPDYDINDDAVPFTYPAETVTGLVRTGGTAGQSGATGQTDGSA